MPVGDVLFGFAAGALSTLSPCVLPLLPLVLGSATGSGLLAVVAGLVISFVGIGLFVAIVGFSIGLDGDVFRGASAVLLALLGVVLLSGALQTRLAVAAGGISNAGNRLIGRLSVDAPGGQFVLGLLLGAVWSPCVGPTLGAASVLAAQNQDLVSVAAVMLAFGVGSALPLLAIGLLLRKAMARQALVRWRGRMLAGGKLGKMLLGISALAVSVLILTGLDHRVEAALVDASPAWLTSLTTRF